jgi:hypothetical protein
VLALLLKNEELVVEDYGKLCNIMKIRFSLLLLCRPARTILAFSPNSHGGTCSSRHRLPILSSSSSKFGLPSSDNHSDCNDTLHQSQPFDKTYNQIKSTDQTFQGINRWVAASLVAVIMLSFSFTSFPFPCYAEDVVADKDIIAEMGLKQPTEFRPQIRLTEDALNSVSTKSKARTPILQGLVYFPERARDKPDDTTSISTSTPSKEPLDYYSDILVLTAVSAKDPSGPILAGAKFPVSSVRFPFSFSMYEQNLLLKRAGVKEAWEDVQNTSDVIIKAYICPSDAVAFPCEDKEVKKYSEGVAKLITELPGLREGEVIRAPASLPLK